MMSADVSEVNHLLLPAITDCDWWSLFRSGGRSPYVVRIESRVLLVLPSIKRPNPVCFAAGMQYTS